MRTRSRICRVRVLGAVSVGVAAILLAACAGGSPRGAGAPARPLAYTMTGAGTGHVVQVDLTADDTAIQEIAPGVKFNAWTFDGTAPGPAIRVRQGDTVRFTLHNASKAMSHSIDFHAAQTPWNLNYQPVGPGHTASFDWVARYPGVFMYHCGTPPVIEHIANGMYGAIVVEPANPLPRAREFVIVQSEFYPAARPTGGAYQGDYNAMTAGRATYVVFNGVSDQYKAEPLLARPGELIRLWVVNAGPSHWSAFHVIGALFDSAYASGNPANAQHGLQTVTIAPGDGEMLELRIPDAGLYPFVTHSFADTGLGALGILKVDPSAPPAPAAYPLLGDPRTAGVTPATGAGAARIPAGSQSSAAPGSQGGSPMPGMSAMPGMPGMSPTGVVNLTAANVAFQPKTLSASAGLVQIRVDNRDPMPHDFTIDALHVKVPLPASSVTMVKFQATPGSYTFYCSIPGHRQAGMEGTLTVLPAGGH